MIIIDRVSMSQLPVTQLNSYDRVGIMLDRDIALISSIYNCIKRNITCVPLDPYWPAERLNVIIKNADIEAVITTAEYSFKIQSAKVVLVSRKSVVDFDDGDVNNEIGYIQHTSGSTGKPKGVEIPRSGLYHFSDCISDIIDMSPKKRIACLSDASFDIFYLESVIALNKGLTIVLAEKEEQKNPRLMAKLITDGFVDIVQMTPTRMQMLMNYDSELICLKNVKKILIGGEPFPITLLHTLQEKTTAKIFNMYGPTEATGWTTVSNLTNKDHIDIGYPIKDTNVYIVNDKCELLPQGEAGEICISGPCVAKGYVKQDKLTLERFVSLPQQPEIRVYRTGDIGRQLHNGAFECIGRIDNQIKLHGYRIEPEEIEFHLNQMDAIKQSIVSITDVNETGKVLTAFYTSDDYLKKQDIIDYLALKLPSYMIPSVFKRVKGFFQSEHGKIDRNKVWKCEEIRHENDAATEDNLAAQQKSILEVVQTELNIDCGKKVYLDTNLYELGVDSISFISLVVALESRFNIEFDDDLLSTSEFSTIQSIIEYVSQKLDLRKKAAIFNLYVGLNVGSTLVEN